MCKKLDIMDTVKFMENSITSGNDSFFVNTEFGKVAFEVESHYDPLSPTTVMRWEEAPPTDWAMKHRSSIASYYGIIGVNNKYSRLSVRMHCIEAISKCIFLHLLDAHPSQEIIDAAVRIYCIDYDMRTYTLNYMEKEFVDLNFNLICKNDSMVKDVCRELIRRRVNESDRIVNEVLNSYVPTGYDNDVIQIKDIQCIDRYYRDMFGLVVYFANMSGVDINISAFDMFDRYTNTEPDYAPRELSVIQVSSKKMGY